MLGGCEHYKTIHH